MYYDTVEHKEETRRYLQCVYKGIAPELREKDLTEEYFCVHSMYQPYKCIRSILYAYHLDALTAKMSSIYRNIQYLLDICRISGLDDDGIRLFYDFVSMLETLSKKLDATEVKMDNTSEYTKLINDLSDYNEIISN